MRPRKGSIVGITTNIAVAFVLVWSLFSSPSAFSGGGWTWRRDCHNIVMDIRSLATEGLGLSPHFIYPWASVQIHWLDTKKKNAPPLNFGQLTTRIDHVRPLLEWVLSAISLASKDILKNPEKDEKGRIAQTSANAKMLEKGLAITRLRSYTQNILGDEKKKVLHISVEDLFALAVRFSHTFSHLLEANSSFADIPMPKDFSSRGNPLFLQIPIQDFLHVSNAVYLRALPIYELPLLTASFTTSQGVYTPHRFLRVKLESNSELMALDQKILFGLFDTRPEYAYRHILERVKFLCALKAALLERSEDNEAAVEWALLYLLNIKKMGSADSQTMYNVLKPISLRQMYDYADAMNKLFSGSDVTLPKHSQLVDAYRWLWKFTTAYLDQNKTKL